MKEKVFATCQGVFEDWKNRASTDFDFDDPKGFSSFTMGIRSHVDAEPKAVLYRHLEDKENAILDPQAEKEVFLMLGQKQIAAQCYHYDEECRIEEFYTGRTLEPKELFESDTLKGIATQLYRFHSLTPTCLPAEDLFTLTHKQWGPMAKKVLTESIDLFPANEQEMCKELRTIYSDDTFKKVQRCLPDGPLTFCHNDTYHGNIFKLDTGEIKLLDFEFSCLNHKTYDFSNLFAETVMTHKLAEYPFFRIEEAKFGDKEYSLLINHYLDQSEFESNAERQKEFDQLLSDTKKTALLSDYKYAMAAITLAVEPIQKIRFIPYALERYRKFLRAVERV